MPAKPLQLPRFTGATIRGAFGFALREAVGDDGAAMALLRTRGTPSPWALRVPFFRRYYAAGEPLEVTLTLIGPSAEHADAVCAALRLMPERGLGRGRVFLRLDDLEDAAVTPAPLASAPAWRFETKSPLRLLRDTRLCFALDAEVLLASVARRCGVSPISNCTIDVEEARFERHRYQRGLGRSTGRMRLDGIVGSAVLRGDLEPALPLLQLGTFAQAGAGTAFGFGAYALTPLEA